MPIISYVYTRPIASKKFNYKHVLRDLNIDDFKSKIPPYLKDQSVPIVSYVYTRPIASKKFNYKDVLRDLNIDGFTSKPPDCTCASSPFIYNPTGHVITGDLKIVKCSPKGLNP